MTFLGLGKGIQVRAETSMQNFFFFSLLLLSLPGLASSNAAKVSICAQVALAVLLSCRRSYRLPVIPTTLFPYTWNTIFSI